jgi:hypothetical protein
MKLIKIYRIESKEKMIKFLNSVPSGTLGTIDANGYPQLIPMNFIYHNDSIYMHSYHEGEKIDNIRRDRKVGFEVHKHVEFLPSYFFDEYDASRADTLYISVVIKGYAEFVTDLNEKANALNALMQKYQKEGGYEPLNSNMNTVKEVTVIKIKPLIMTGKYKLGQYWPIEYRREIANKIKIRNPNAIETLRLMGFNERLEYISEPDW